MARIDPGLLRLADAAAAAPGDVPADERTLVPAAAPKPNVMIELEGAEEPPRLAELGFERQTRAGNIMTGKIPLESIKELATVRNAARVAAALRSRYPKTPISTVINRRDGNAEIGQRDVEKAVGGSIAHQFPNDYARALTAMHKGRPVALDNHNQLSATLTALARDLAGVEDEKVERASGGLKGFLSGRRSSEQATAKRTNQ